MEKFSIVPTATEMEFATRMDIVIVSMDGHRRSVKVLAWVDRAIVDRLLILTVSI
jgi:hypothetical protein